MEKLLTTINSSDSGGVLLSLCLILTFQLVFNVIKFLWSIKKEKEQLSEKTIAMLVSTVSENTSALKHLDIQIKKLESTFAELPKFKLDLRRLYHAMKLVAGEEWVEIRNEIMRDFTEQDFK